MKGIRKEKIKIKNLIGIVDNPTHDDLLFEIVTFLEKENRLEEEFIKHEVNLKTRCRIEEDLDKDLKKLVEVGYLEHLGWTKFKVIKHPW
jgi:hypothetical protein